MSQAVLLLLIEIDIGLFCKQTTMCADVSLSRAKMKSMFWKALEMSEKEMCAFKMMWYRFVPFLYNIKTRGLCNEEIIKILTK